MGKLWVEACLLSAQGLRVSSLFKLQWFAVGWIDPRDKYCTGIDTSGTTNPVWKTRFATGIDVPSESGLQDLALQVEVYSREPIFLRESLQGKATIALKDILQKCGGKRGVSRPVEESGRFPLRRINGSSKADRGFVQVSIRVSSEREEPGLSNRVAGKGFDFMQARKDGLSFSPPREGPGIHPQQETRSGRPRKFVQTPRQAVKTVSEDPGSNQSQRIILNSRQAEETLPEDPRNNRSPKIILARRQAVETLYEDRGSNQNPRQAVEAPPEEPIRNQLEKSIPRREVDTLSEDLRTNQPRKIILSRRQVVETLPKDPRSTPEQKIILNRGQAVEVHPLHDDHPGRNRTRNSLSTPQRTSETWFEEQGSNRALESRRPDSRTPYQPCGSLSPLPPPSPPPANVGYIPTFFPRADNNQRHPVGPGFSAEALAAAAVIFGDDFLSGFHFGGGLGNSGVSVPTDCPYCTSPVNMFQQ